MDQQGSKINWQYLGLCLLLLVVGTLIGGSFPDYDRTYLKMLPGIQHRSLLTHGVLAPLLLYLLITKRDYHPALRYAVMGFCVGVAMHLSFDLFPQGAYGRYCHGYACIYSPIVGRTGSLFSFFWIALGIVGSLYIMLRLIERKTDIVLIIPCAIFSYSGMAKLEPHIAMEAFWTFVVAVVFVLLMPAERYNTLFTRFTGYIQGVTKQ